MAIAYDTAGHLQVNGGSTNTTSVTVASTSHRYMFVEAQPTITSVSYAGVALSLLTTFTPTATGGANPAPAIKIWGLADPATGSNTLSITGTAGYDNQGCSYVVYNGVDATQPPAYNTTAPTYSPGNQYSSSLDTTLTTTVDKSWVINFFMSDTQSSTITPSVGTARDNGNVGLFGPYRTTIFDSNAQKTPAGSYAFTGTFSSGSYGISSVTYELKSYLALSFSGPSSGNVNSASTNFTVTPDIAITGTVTITPTGAGSAGLSPTILTFSNSATPQTFTITPLTSGAITLTMTNAVGLNNPSPLTYTANAVVPGAPTIGTAVPANASASVAFSAPVSDGGATITSYRAISTPGSITGTGTSSPITVSGLTNSTAYTFTVRATNSVGNSSESSASNSVTPYVAATSFTLTGPSSGNVRAASTNFTVTPNAIFDGTITITPTGTAAAGLGAIVLTFNHTSAAQTFTITPETSGVITLVPTNSGTLSNPSNLTYTANAVAPLPPQIGVASPSISSAYVSFSEPTNTGGATITSYTITSSPGGITLTTNEAGTFKITGLTNGTSYTFTVTATNSAGTSSASTASNAVTPSTSPSSFVNSGPKFGISGDIGSVLTFNTP